MSKNWEMKIEMDDNTSVSTVVIIVAAALCLLVNRGCKMEHEEELIRQQTIQKSIEAGMVEKQNVGTYGTHWSKP